MTDRMRDDGGMRDDRVASIRLPGRKGAAKTARAKALGHLAACAIAATVFLVGGCHLTVNPFEDDLADRKPVTTSSVLTVRAHDAAQSDLRRDVALTRVPAADGRVTHGPLYFESPFEEDVWDDGRFALTWVDYFDVLYWRGRFLFNAIAMPVSVVVTPPWTTMVSDGQPSRSIAWAKHDASVGKPLPQGTHWASVPRAHHP